MSHELTIREDGFVEAAFAVQPAWHGLGVVFSRPMTSKEALKLAGLDWSVVPEKLYIRINDEYKEVPGFIANVRDDNHAVLGVVSKNYTHVSNVQAFEFLDSLIENGEMLYESAFSLNGGKQVVLLARTPGCWQIAKGDTILPYLLFKTSHDGRSAISFGPVSVRVVCANTLRLAESTHHLIRIPHTSTAFEKLEQVRQAMRKFNSDFASFIALANELAQVDFKSKWNKFLDKLLPLPQDNTVDSLETKIKLIALRDELTKRFRNERNSLFGIEGTAWAAFCAVVEAVDHPEKKNRLTPNYFMDCLVGTGHEFKMNALRTIRQLISA